MSQPPLLSGLTSVTFQSSHWFFCSLSNNVPPFLVVFFRISHLNLFQRSLTFTHNLPHSFTLIFFPTHLQSLTTCNTCLQYTHANTNGNSIDTFHFFISGHNFNYFCLKISLVQKLDTCLFTHSTTASSLQVLL